jgi:hypothetical protein
MLGHLARSLERRVQGVEIEISVHHVAVIFCLIDDAKMGGFLILCNR